MIPFLIAIILGLAGLLLWQQRRQALPSANGPKLAARDVPVEAPVPEVSSPISAEDPSHDALIELHLSKRLREAEANADREARALLLSVIERTAAERTAEATVAIIPLASEDLKGRIIGREGRNIRHFESVTGTDLLLDESADSVTISTFDPLRREVASRTLLALLKDGRIHPARIEEEYARAQTEVDRGSAEAGSEAAQRAGVLGLSAAIAMALGTLRFRTSTGQNVLGHSVEAAQIAGMIAAELRFDEAVARRAALLHDIGKGLPPGGEDRHALAGGDFLRRHKERDAIVHAVSAHHHDIEPLSPEARIVIIADAISAARPGARREGVDNYIKRMQALETIANDLPEVERVFAAQAGRELRVLARAEVVDDAGSARLADLIARRVEASLTFPAPITVTVLRETRTTAIAKPPRPEKT